MLVIKLHIFIAKKLKIKKELHLLGNIWVVWTQRYLEYWFANILKLQVLFLVWGWFSTNFGNNSMITFLVMPVWIVITPIIMYLTSNHYKWKTSICRNKHILWNVPEAQPPIQVSWWRSQLHGKPFGSLVLSYPVDMNIRTVCAWLNLNPTNHTITCLLTLICLCRISLVIFLAVMTNKVRTGASRC